MSERGTVLTLVLDAVDPRLDEGRRTDAVAEALMANPTLAATTWAGMLFGVLHSLRGQYGDPALGEIMAVLASIALSVVDMDAAGPDCGMGGI